DLVVSLDVVQPRPVPSADGAARALLGPAHQPGAVAVLEEDRVLPAQRGDLEQRRGTLDDGAGLLHAGLAGGPDVPQDADPRLPARLPAPDVRASRRHVTTPHRNSSRARRRGSGNDLPAALTRGR